MEQRFGRVHDDPKDCEPRIAALVKKKHTREAAASDALRAAALRDLEREEDSAKKRRRCDLGTGDMLDIVHAVVVEKLTPDEAAGRHRVKTRLVRKLVKQMRRGELPLREIRQQQADEESKRVAVLNCVSGMFSQDRPACTVQEVLNAAQAATPLVLKARFVRRTLKEDLGLRYRKIPRTSKQANSYLSLHKRQEFAKVLLALLDGGKRIINVDESWLDRTDFRRRSWQDP